MKEKQIKSLFKDYKKVFNLFLKIEELGTKKAIPFRLNSAQEALHDIAETQLKTRGYVRIMLLKSRRMGMSTYLAARFFLHSVTRHNRHIHICTHEEDLTREIFRWVQSFKANYPEALTPQPQYSNRKELIWNNDEGTGLNTLYSLSTAGGIEKRGRGYDYLHESEVASKPWTGDFALGMESSVVTGGGTEIYRESTAKGIGGFFHSEYLRAEAGDSDYEAVFFPFWVMDNYKIPFSSQSEKESFGNALGSNLMYGGKEETDLLGAEWKHECSDGRILKKICTLEHLKWRQTTIRGTAQGDLDKFKQEFPSTAQEAFIMSGKTYFSVPILRSLRLKLASHPPKSQRYTVATGRFKDNKPTYSLKPDPKGKLRIFTPPNKLRCYRMGVDVAEGIEISGSNRDYSAIVVKDAETSKDVAIWHGRIAPGLLAWIITTLGRYYKGVDGCWTGVERNNHGLTTLTLLNDLHQYNRIFFETIVDEDTKTQTRKLGWLTTSKTKPLMIDELASRIDEECHGMISLDVVDECLTFVKDAKGKLGAEAGCHDDLVIAEAIALQMVNRHSIPRKKQKQKKLRNPQFWFLPHNPANEV